MVITFYSVSSFSYKIGNGETSEAELVDGRYTATVDAIADEIVHLVGESEIYNSSVPLKTLRYENFSNSEREDNYIDLQKVESLTLSGDDPHYLNKTVSRCRISTLDVSELKFENVDKAGSLLWFTNVENISGSIHPKSYGFSKIDKIEPVFGGEVLNVEAANTVDGDTLSAIHVSKLQTIGSDTPEALKVFNIKYGRGDGLGSIDIQPGIYNRFESNISDGYTFEMSIKNSPNETQMDRENTNATVYKNDAMDDSKTFEMTMVAQSSYDMEREKSINDAFDNSDMDDSKTFEMDIVVKDGNSMERELSQFDCFKDDSIDDSMTFEADIVNPHFVTSNLDSVPSEGKVEVVEEFVETSNSGKIVYGFNGFATRNIVDGDELSIFTLNSGTGEVELATDDDVDASCTNGYKYDNITSLQNSFYRDNIGSRTSGDKIIRSGVSTSDYALSFYLSADDGTFYLNGEDGSDVLNWTSDLVNFNIDGGLKYGFISNLTRSDGTSYLYAVYDANVPSYNPYSTRIIECEDEFLNNYNGSTSTIGNTIVFVGDNEALKVYSANSLSNSSINMEVIRLFETDEDENKIQECNFSKSRGVFLYNGSHYVFKENSDGNNVVAKLNIT